MPEQNTPLKTRIMHKHKLEVEWMDQGIDLNFVPKAGELIIYDPEVDDKKNVITRVVNGTTVPALPDGRDEPYTTSRVKVGDGYRCLRELEFIGCATDHLGDAVFYCGDSVELTEDPYASAEYIVACGDSARFINIK